jgi:hypothetical protein
MDMNDLKEIGEKRARELIRYYREPNYCSWCNNLIEVGKGESIQLVDKRKYCSRTCAGYMCGRSRKGTKKVVVLVDGENNE